MESTACLQGQAKGIGEPHTLIPISEGIPQDILSSFRVQEGQEVKKALHPAPPWEIFFPMFPGELRNYLPATLADLDLQSRERSLSGRLVESWISEFTIHLRVELTSAEEEALMEAMRVDEMEHIHGGE